VCNNNGDVFYQNSFWSWQIQIRSGFFLEVVVYERSSKSQSIKASKKLNRKSETFRVTSQKSKCSKYFLFDLSLSSCRETSIVPRKNLIESYSGRRGFTTEGFYCGGVKKLYFGGLRLSASSVKQRVDLGQYTHGTAQPHFLKILGLPRIYHRRGSVGAIFYFRAPRIERIERSELYTRFRHWLKRLKKLAAIFGTDKFFRTKQLFSNYY
jgi:hypothetical protein